jgi:RNA polymerase sigma-70 factor (ECF subfamily)
MQQAATPQDGSQVGLRAAFDELIRPLLGTGYALAFAMLRDRQEAEDAVQEAALKAWRAMENANRDGRSPRPWFLAIVGNQCRDVRRAGWSRVLKPGFLPEREAKDHAASVAERVDIERALAGLTRQQRAMLYLRYGLDMAPQEIAEVLSLRLGTVKSRLHRTVRRLEEKMR